MSELQTRGAQRRRHNICGESSRVTDKLKAADRCVFTTSATAKKAQGLLASEYKTDAVQCGTFNTKVYSFPAESGNFILTRT